MGLDTSHDCFRGAYSSFMRFRVSLAKTCGIDLENMNGFKRVRFEMVEGVSWESSDIPKGARIFLSHSDCDGKLTVEECVHVLAWMITVPLEDEYQESQRIRFTAGLNDAIDAQEEVEFH